MPRIRSVHPDICNDETLAEVMPSNWCPERCPEVPLTCYNADDLLAALVAHADGRGRFYGDPRLVRTLFWEQEPPVEVIGGYMAELIDRGDLRRGRWYRISDHGRPRPLVTVTNRQRYHRWRKRLPIPDAVRSNVMRRDRSRCLECGAVDRLSLDHIVPWSLGGPDTEDNLRVLCQPCNSRKGNRV
jgi:hypothetical protein